MVIWITGISGAGKSTVCETIRKKIKGVVPELVVLDGDVIRSTFDNAPDFTETGRTIQIRRIQGLANILDKQGLVVLVAALYAHPDLLAWNRQNFDNYQEIYLDAPLELVKERDPKGLYAKAGRGEMPNVVGVDVPWHAPTSADIRFDMTLGQSVQSIADQIIEKAGLCAEHRTLTH